MVHYVEESHFVVVSESLAILSEGIVHAENRIQINYHRETVKVQVYKFQYSNFTGLTTKQQQQQP